MSLSYLLIECPFAFGKTLSEGVASEPALYGRAFHELVPLHVTAAMGLNKPVSRATVAKVALKHAVKAEELAPHATASGAKLYEWLRKNEFKLDFDAIRKRGMMLIERAVALRPGVSGRSIPEHDENHRYAGVGLDEQPGTLDLSIIPPKRELKKLPVLIEDHKTSEFEDFSKPLDKAQLLSLAAAVMRWVGSESAVIAVLHARRRGLPKVYADTVKLHELKRYEGRVASSLARIGDGSMRPGAWCKYCPAQEVCPARDAELLARAGDVLTGLTAAGGALSKEGLTANDVVLARVPPGKLTHEKKLGLLYDVVRKAEALAGRARAEIKDAIIESGGSLLPETSNGEYLTVRTYKKETVSKSGIIEAYGKMAGERLLSKLRKDGAMNATTVKQLWPEKDRGR